MKAFLLGASLIALGIPACADNHNPPDDGDDVADPGDQMDQGEDPTDPVDPPTEEEVARDNDELAQVIAAHVRGEFPIQLAAAQISKGVFPAGFSPTGQDPSTGEDTGVGTVDGLSFTFSYHCNNGDELHTRVACDGLAHHSHMLWTMTGAETVGNMSMVDMHRQVNWEIRDLLDQKARFRGPDNVQVSSDVSLDGEVSSYTLNFDAAYEKVRFMPNAVIPTFGTIDFSLNVERVRGEDHRVFETAAQLVYGASGVPTTLTLGGSLVYTIDLETGVVAKR
jgi:hypothetical protein